MDAAAVGRMVEERRRAAGLTQAELARRIGTTQPAISKIESGRTLPGLELLDRVARALGRPIAITLGASPTSSAEERRRRVRRALKGFEFDPWDRGPTAAERDSLLADELTPERFQDRSVP